MSAPNSDALRLQALNFIQQLRQVANNPFCTPEVLLGVLDSATRPVRQQRAPKELPAILDASSVLANPIVEPPQLIKGLLHQGEKLVLGGGSKSFKSWALIDMLLSVSHGLPWLSFETARTRALYLNLELPPWAMQQRLEGIAREIKLTLEPSQFDVWKLRGFSAPYDRMLPQLEDIIGGGNYGLIALDPIYKVYGQLDENSAGVVAELMNALEQLIANVKAALAFTAHFPKGNQALKDSIDRISGSGVFARDPDALLMLTRHEEENAFTVEATLRSFPPVEPFVVRWGFPLFDRAADLDPRRLKKCRGRTREHSFQTLLLPIVHTSTEVPISISAWAKRVGVARSTLRGYLEDLRLYAWIQDTPDSNGVYITELGKQAVGFGAAAGKGGEK